MIKDQNSFRQVTWLDPFDVVKYLSIAVYFFEKIEAERLDKSLRIVHSHRRSESNTDLFDSSFGYDSFRERSSELTKQYFGKWKVVADVANFFDRISFHSLENHLLEVGCEKSLVTHLNNILLFWAGDRRSFGIPVGSDASRILSEAVLLNVDKKMVENDVEFIRYVDDYRIFANSRERALACVQLLTELLAEEGLSLNSKKTNVFQIILPEEQSLAKNSLDVEHETIDLAQKEEVRVLSGKTTVSRYYREPGKDAKKKLEELRKDDILADIHKCDENEFENVVKKATKFFVYVDQDVSFLQALIKKKATAIFYIADALQKESHNFSIEKRMEIKAAILSAAEWKVGPYVYLVPVMRILANSAYSDHNFVRQIISNFKKTDNILFFREAFLLGAKCLDRSDLRSYARDHYSQFPALMKRAIFEAVGKSERLNDSERRPLLRNLKEGESDWFIQQLPDH